jgi:outer membrane receptor protein involved in Fe transport
MLLFPSKTKFGPLTLAVMLTLGRIASAQSVASVHLTVEDNSGAAIAGALIESPSAQPLAHTDATGSATFECVAPCAVRITATGFAAQTVTLNGETTIHLAPEAYTEQITVTAYRTPLGALESPASTRQLTQAAMHSTAAVTLDGKMRQLPGVELYRRSSSLVANPTSQGVSLRGLGSTSASRTLVTEDDQPLNDPLGGWIEWNQQPELAIRDVEVVRGGASDLYGSSAIGGVISVMPELPAAKQVELTSSYESESTIDEGVLAQTMHGPWGVLGAGGVLGTDGYIQEAAAQRGPIDQPSNVHGQNALIEGDHHQGPLRLFARASAFNEWRHNGTPYQINGTRLLRYITGGDWKTPNAAVLGVRIYGADERYRQTFSSITNVPELADPTCVYRCNETPTKYTFAPVNELGAAAHWSQPLGAGLVVLAGAGARDVRVWDEEQSFTGAATTNLHDHQRDSGAYGEIMWVRGAWTVAAAGRLDWFQNYDGRQFQWTGSLWTPSATQPPQFGQRLFNPRLGVSRRLGEHWALTATGFRAFRAPTPSELYRATQVGNELTKANASLLSERATGWETGVASERRWGTVRASYFLTQVNRPITAVTINLNSSPILLMRENLGQIESRGVSLDFGLVPASWLAVDGGYQYAHAVVSRGGQDLGNWIPEVARNMATLNLRTARPRLGTVSLQSRLSGHMYDDDANQFLLHGYFRLDAYGAHDFGSRFQLFAAAENLTDRAIEVSKTPTTTLADGRTARIGILVRLGESSR